MKYGAVHFFFSSTHSPCSTFGPFTKYPIKPTTSFSPSGSTLHYFSIISYLYKIADNVTISPTIPIADRRYMRDECNVQFNAL